MGDMEGEPAAEGNLVIPSPILLSSAAAAAEEEEEEEEEEEQTRPLAARHQPTLKRATRERSGSGDRGGLWRRDVVPCWSRVSVVRRLAWSVVC